MTKISLCTITGNEATHVERFLDSFGPCFDELVMVRAIGNQTHDRTLSLAKEWCSKHGKAFVGGEYLNGGIKLPEGTETPVDDNRPETWKHVSDFGAARNLSWNLATGKWKLWADLDDILQPGSAEIIRTCSESEKYDLFYFAYHIPQGATQEKNMRERLHRAGISSWHGPIHENCHPFPNQKARACFEERVVFSHEPKHDKQRDPERNARIMRFHSRFLWMFFELFRESYYKWCVSQTETDENEALKWAELADKTELHPEMRAQMYLYLAHLHSKKDHGLALEQAWAAIRIAPMLRDGWAWLAELELMGPSKQRARMFTTFMQSMPKPSGATGIPRSLRWHGENGLLLRTRSLRADGDEEGARKTERTIFAAHGKRFSLLHATRGRPQKAIEARANFMAAALNPLCVEHIFAIDEDDKKSLEALKFYRHVVVKEPRGCVKAWNEAAAASEGNVLVQLSDDWMPCQHWDEFMWLALRDRSDIINQEDIVAKKITPDDAVGATPLVLAISDGHRKDALLCMAILTRARYEQQVEGESEAVRMSDEAKREASAGNGLAAAILAAAAVRKRMGPYIFHPDYFGVFSDNEFTVRAYQDNVIVDAKHIILEHEHPIFKGVPQEKWDDTHLRQNAPERYAEGKEVFNRRNPAFAIP